MRVRRKVYPFSPLVEVVFEIRFDGEPSVECRRDDYFKRIRKDYPRVHVPQITAGAAPLQPYQFKSSDEKSAVMAAIDRFAFSTTSYEGFERFKPRALGLAKTFCRLYGIKTLNRVGLRYVNLIPFVRESGLIPWSHYFSVSLAPPKALPVEFMNVKLAYENLCGSGKITTRISTVKKENDEDAFVLDFDFAKTKLTPVAKLNAVIEESHAHTNDIFENIVSDDYRAVMKGEVVK